MIQDLQKKYDVSIVVLTYNSSDTALFKTLNSIITQRGVSFQIIIADDGSHDFNEKLLDNYFIENSFSDYIIAHQKINQGICKNYYNGLLNAEGEYVKPISPGDYFVDECVLSRWYKFLKERSAILSFGKLVYYVNGGGKASFEIMSNLKPRNIEVFKSGSIFKQQLDYIVLADYPIGAGFISKRLETIEYLKNILCRIKYCEDTIYQMMLIDGNRVHFFEEDVIKYECSSGISTSNNNKWNKLIDNDLKEAQILISKAHGEKDNYRTFMIRKYLGYRIKKNNIFSKYMKYVIFPQLLFLRKMTKR